MKVLGEKFYATLAQKHFAYLVTDYGFALDRVIPGSDAGRRLEAAEVIWVSPVAQVRVSFDNDVNGVDIGPRTNPLGKKPWYDLGYIADFKAGADVFRGFKSQARKYNLETAMDEELAYHAAALRQHCDEMLRGDFSILPDLDEWLGRGGSMIFIFGEIQNETKKKQTD